ncbi:MAG: DUF3047 domain-containing protein [Burkholderiaceae bacterium]
MAALPAWLFGCAAAPPASVDPTQSWQPFTLPGKRETRYVASQKEGRPAWHARAESSASMLRRALPRVDASGRSVEFAWWVPFTIAGADLSRAETADSPVRVAFAFDGDHARLPTRTRMQYQLAEVLTGEVPPYATLMYVWDNLAPVESIVHSPRSDRIRKIVLESGDRNLNRWCVHRRALAADFMRAFGEPPGPIVGIALMTDADNTGTRAEAWYGDVVLI